MVKEGVSELSTFGKIAISIFILGTFIAVLNHYDNSKSLLLNPQNGMNPNLPSSNPQPVSQINDQNIQEATADDSELSFISPEYKDGVVETIETNPVIIIKSFEQNNIEGEDLVQSLQPLEFFIAPEGSEKFTSISVNYNVGDSNPGTVTAVPCVFTGCTPLNSYSLTESGEVVSAEDNGPLPPGNYKLKVRRKPVDPNGVWKEKTIPIRWNPPSDADFLKTLPAGTTCGCQSITMEDFGAIDSYFLKSFLVYGMEGSPTDLGASTVVKPGYLIDEYNYHYLFQIKATLTAGSYPSLCEEGQLVKATFTYKKGTSDEYQSVPAIRNGLPRSFSGGPGNYKNELVSTIVNQETLNTLIASGANINSFPVDGEEYIVDDYKHQSVLKYYNGPIIKWFDAPGTMTTYGNFPIEIHAKFIHYVKPNSVIVGQGQTIDNAWIRQVIGGQPSCKLESELIINVDEKGNAKYSMKHPSSQ